MGCHLPLQLNPVDGVPLPPAVDIGQSHKKTHLNPNQIGCAALPPTVHPFEGLSPLASVHHASIR